MPQVLARVLVRTSLIFGWGINMTRICIYPYKMSSKSSKDLANALREQGHNVLRVYPDRAYRVREDDLIISWGSSKIPRWGQTNLNKPDRVSLAANKLFSLLSFYRDGVSTLPYTTEISIAREWINEGYKAFCRTLLTGHSGNGIVVANTQDELVVAPLYTKGFNKTNEYRVHVWGDGVLDVQEKRKREGTGGRSSHNVWNHGNDFIFARNDINVPTKALEQSILAVRSLGLDFGAVDVGHNRNTDQVAIFEVNTAPGICGTTLSKYVEKTNEISTR